MKKIWQTIRSYWLFWAALFGVLLAIGFAAAQLMTISNWILAIVCLAEVIPLLIDMWRDLRKGAYGVDILAATAIVVAVVMQEYWAAIVIVLMLTGGEALEDYAGHRAKRELDALLERAPQTAHVMRGRQVVDVKISEVKIGDKIILRPGEVVPVDAEILTGMASFDESSLTGESLPELKQIGDKLLSGSINLDGAITARALRIAADSQYEQIIKLVQAASKSQAPFVRLADRYAIPFTLISFAIAGLAWFLSGESIRFLEVLVVATPCPLILAAPIAVISGMSQAARFGIIVRNGAALERLATTKTFAFDKTGTLTEGKLIVEKVWPFNSFKVNEVLSLAAGVEQNSNHVIARAIVARAQASKVKITNAKRVKEISGQGLSAVIGGQEILVGRLILLTANKVDLPNRFSAQRYQQTAAFVAINGKLAGVITFKDSVRSDAKSTLDKLRHLGINNFLMVTGDKKTTAQAIARQLGIKNIKAETLPGDKIKAIENIELRPVTFVGDGINDAPVLHVSDVGIALSARGSTAASESADVVVMLDDLGHVATAYQIARRTFFIAKQSILIGISLSVVLMLIFATGKFPPLYGAIIQEVVDVIVIFNALRAHSSVINRVSQTTAQK